MATSFTIGLSSKEGRLFDANVISGKFSGRSIGVKHESTKTHLARQLDNKQSHGFLLACSTPTGHPDEDTDVAQSGSQPVLSRSQR